MITRRQRFASGFTLIEMIVVIVITGIIGGIVAMFIRAPVQGYVDSARRAEMTDIADTALRRIARDLHGALPNSVRINTSGVAPNTVFYLDFLATSSSGRYRLEKQINSDDILKFPAVDDSFEVLSPPPSCVGNVDQIVIYNLGTGEANAYAAAPNNNRTTCLSIGGTPTIANIVAKKFPFESPTQRFHIVNQQVRYVCDPTAGNNSLTRYSWPANNIIAPAAAIPGVVGQANALLATSVGGCNFIYDPNVIAQRSGLVTLLLTLSQAGESVVLYGTFHISNEP